MAKRPQDPQDGDHQTDARQNNWEDTAFGRGERGTGIRPTPAGHRPDAARHAAPGGADGETAVAERDASQAVVEAKRHAEELGEALHAKFMQLLNDKVRETDGRLTPDDVDEMGAEFRRELETIETVFLKLVETYALAQTDRRPEQDRSQFFYRLMVGKLSDRFADERTLRSHPDLLSRRMLPGFFSMLSLMFGRPRIEDYEQRMQKLVDQHQANNNGQVDWDELERSPEARRISLRAEIEIAKFFSNIDKRFDWMIAIVNSNIIPPDDRHPHEPWAFNTDAAEALLAGLFRDVRPALENQSSRETFVARMGADTVATLDRVVQRFSGNGG